MDVPPELVSAFDSFDADEKRLFFADLVGRLSILGRVIYTEERISDAEAREGLKGLVEVFERLSSPLIILSDSNLDADVWPGETTLAALLHRARRGRIERGTLDAIRRSIEGVQRRHT